MAIKVALTHITKYRFDRPVELGPHVSGWPRAA